MRTPEFDYIGKQLNLVTCAPKHIEKQSIVLGTYEPESFKTNTYAHYACAYTLIMCLYVFPCLWLGAASAKTNPYWEPVPGNLIMVISHVFHGAL